MNQAMSESERIRHIQEQANKFVSRRKCVDSSLMTMMAQAKASSTSKPSTVPLVVNRGGCATNAVTTGVGTQMDYTAILQKAQGCAICPDFPTPNTNISSIITLAVPCINNLAPPFTQRNLSTMYNPACTDPGKRDYFPAPIFDGPNCQFNRITTPSG